MKARLLFASLFLLTLLAGSAHAQRTCGTMDRWNQAAAANPDLVQRRADAIAHLQSLTGTQRTAGVLTIPVVVHVLYENAAENISTAQVQSQIQVMNEDFRALNADIIPLSHPFGSAVGDAGIEFCLASVDPQGNPTNGITRTSTTVTEFTDADDAAKFTSLGGHDNWDPTRYLNIWVCDLGAQLLGYATFPDELTVSPDLDGVVINYTAFGTNGTASAPSDLGRTATHEIGHWLFLYHIWGDQTCGDDFVADTEPAEQDNYGCPAFPNNPNSACGSGPDGEMYMNYMDYVDDNCMNMFTILQGDRMRNALNTYRSALLTSAACTPTAVADPSASLQWSLSPNPSAGEVVLDVESGSRLPVQVQVCNALGVPVYTQAAVRAFPYRMDLSALPAGLYHVRMQQGRTVASSAIVVQH